MYLVAISIGFGAWPQIFMAHSALKDSFASLTGILVLAIG